MASFSDRKIICLSGAYAEWLNQASFFFERTGGSAFQGEGKDTYSGGHVRTDYILKA